MRGLVSLAIMMIFAGAVAYGQDSAAGSIDLAGGDPTVERPVAPGGGVTCIVLRKCSEGPPELGVIMSGVEALSSDPSGSVIDLSDEHQAVPCFAEPSCLAMLRGWAIGLETIIAEDTLAGATMSPNLASATGDPLLIVPEVRNCLDDSECSEGIDAFVGEWTGDR